MKNKNIHNISIMRLKYNMNDDITDSDSDSSSNTTDSSESESELDLELGLESDIWASEYPCGLSVNVPKGVHKIIHPECNVIGLPKIVPDPTLLKIVSVPETPVIITTPVSEIPIVSTPIPLTPPPVFIDPSVYSDTLVASILPAVPEFTPISIPEFIPTTEPVEVSINWDWPSYEMITSCTGQYPENTGNITPYDMSIHGYTVFPIGNYYAGMGVNNICTVAPLSIETTTPVPVTNESLKDRIVRLQYERDTLEKAIKETKEAIEIEEEIQRMKTEQEAIELKKRKEQLILTEIKNTLSFKLAQFGMAISTLLNCGLYSSLDDLVLTAYDRLPEVQSDQSEKCVSEKIRNNVIREALEIKYTELVNDMNDPHHDCRLVPLNESTYPNLYDTVITDSYKIANLVQTQEPEKK